MSKKTKIKQLKSTNIEADKMSSELENLILIEDEMRIIAKSIYESLDLNKYETSI